ncbi:MAG: hypothetical protein ACOYK9_06690 [Chlamydiia bacterium]
MNEWALKEGVVFALAEKLISKDGGALPCELVFSERLGYKVLRPLYRVLRFVSKNIRIPLAICLFTMLAALITGIVFYEVPALLILGKLFPAQSIRFLLFMYVELNLLALGGVAFGRFHNKALIRLWKKGLLLPVMPGDRQEGGNHI